MTRMIRPCKLGEETFDACDFTGEVAFITKDVSADIHQDLRCYAKFFTKDVRVSYTTPLHRYKTELSQYVNKVNYTIHQALNAPVLTTEEVLAGLPEEGEFLIQNVTWGFDFIDTDCIYILKNNRFIDSHLFNPSDDSVDVLEDLKENSFEIQAKNEIALDYLLQFYTDGTPIQVGG